jgi:hypothetical protein
MPSFRKSCRLCHVDKNGMARQSTGDNIKQRMRFAHWITKAREARSEYVIINAFPGQQCLRERVSMLRLYVHSLVVFWKLQTSNPESVAPSHHFHVNDRPNSAPWSYSVIGLRKLI